MKLQGVNILRITDFRRFFELAEFWMHREEFTTLANSFLASLFCDNEEEQCLFDAVRNWCAGHTVMAELKEQELILQDGIKDCKHFFLGRLAPAIATERNQLGPKDLIGLTALYLLLGADKKGSDIPLQYSMLATLQTGNVVGEFMPLFDNCEFSIINDYIAPAKCCTIANMHPDIPITVTAGNSVVTLNKGECIVGLFCNNSCYKLLPNKQVDPKSSVGMRLVYNPTTHKPCLRISHSGVVDTIEGVSSIILERGGYPVYTTMDGILHFDHNCFSLKQSYDTLCTHIPNVKLLAIEQDTNENYTFYTQDDLYYY